MTDQYLERVKDPRLGYFMKEYGLRLIIELDRKVCDPLPPSLSLLLYKVWAIIHSVSKFSVRT